MVRIDMELKDKTEILPPGEGQNLLVMEKYTLLSLIGGKFIAERILTET